MNPLKQNQESMLRESIKHFLTSYHSGSSDYFSFESIFFRLIQAMLDPPLEITWFYAAATFHTAKRNSPPSRVLIAKDLLNLMVSCSNLSCASKKIVLLAPVVYDLYSTLRGSGEIEPCERMEAGKLVEDMVGYAINAGAYDCGNEDAECDNTVACFEDLIHVWTTDGGGGGSGDFVENLKMFFPLLSHGILKRVIPDCGVRELAGIVLLEVFFLRLYMRFSSGIYTEGVLKDARDQAVETIKGFQNFYFLDMLLKMLSGPNLPVAASMSYENALLLRKVLYDATILVEYSFYSGKWVQSSTSQSKKLALAWVIAADQGIQFARDSGDQYRALAYLNAFRECQLVAELIKWVSDHHGLVDPNAIPDVTNPKALIKWLLVLDSHGIEVFDHSMTVLHAKAVACVSSKPPEFTLFQTRNLNKSVFDLGESDESGGSAEPACLVTVKNDAGRKRKESLNGLQEPQMKQVKLDHLVGSVGDNFLSLSSGGGGDGRGVTNLDSSDDDDMDLVR